MDLPLRNSQSELGTSASTWKVDQLVLAAAYAVLGTLLLLSRLVGLNHSLNVDELQFLDFFVRAGPREILTGNSLGHEFYALLSWMTASVVGESAVMFRLWSAVPFIFGVALVTGWLHRRHDPIAGVLFLFLATVSPLLLDNTRQARGYGLAFLAMAVVIVAAFEAKRTGRAVALIPMFAAGVIGAWTLPQVGIGFVATLAVLVLDRRLRVPAATGLLVTAAASVSVYAPHLGAVQSASQTEVGEREIRTTWVLTAPFDQILFPALIWIDGAKITPSVVWLPLIVFALLVMGSSPFVRRRDRGTAPMRGARGDRRSHLARRRVRHGAVLHLPPRANVHPPRQRGGGDLEEHPCTSRRGTNSDMPRRANRARVQLCQSCARCDSPSQGGNP